MYCSNCGNEIQDGHKFCANCGAPVEVPEQPPVTNQNPVNPFPAAPEAPQSRPYERYQQNAGTGYNTSAGNAGTGYNASAGNAGTGYTAPAGNAGNGYPGGSPMLLKTDRSLVVYILLSIITCGIYGYYFFYKMAEDVNVACDGDGQTTPGLLQLILLSIITCGIYGLYWEYCLGNRLAANGPRYGLNIQENGTTVLLWYLLGFLICGVGPYVAMYFLIKNTNIICDAYNRYVTR